MIVTADVLVLSTLPYGDTSLIVRGFSKLHGKESFLVKGARKNRKQNGLLRPGMFLKITHYRKSGDLHLVKELQSLHPLANLYADPYKLCQITFICEVLQLVLPTHFEDAKLYGLLEERVIVFSQQENTPDFHVLLLFELAVELGIDPEDSWMAFGANAGWHPEVIQAGSALFRDGISIGKTSLRREVLIGILNYLSKSLDIPLQPKSLPVLLEVFADN
ncbi:MAG TPA: DNA repair protein RecO [Luteibaculaceae bacterium]|nr:DNA repair protein RecO [Luteibaculaceae bacterium]